MLMTAIHRTVTNGFLEKCQFLLVTLLNCLDYTSLYCTCRGMTYAFYITNIYVTICIFTIPLINMKVYTTRTRVSVVTHGCWCNSDVIQYWRV